MLSNNSHLLAAKKCLFLFFCLFLIFDLSNAQQQKPLTTGIKFNSCLKSGNVVFVTTNTIFVPNIVNDCQCEEENLKFYTVNNQLISCSTQEDVSDLYLTYPGITNISVEVKCGEKLLEKLDLSEEAAEDLLETKLNFNLVQLKPFKRLAHGLKSGPIAIIDKDTFFVPNLFYDGRGPDAYFFIGKGNKGPEADDTTMVKIPNEKGSLDILNKYNGDNIFLTVPSEYNIQDYAYLGMYCVKFKHNFGYTELNSHTQNLQCLKKKTPKDESDADSGSLKTQSAFSSPLQVFFITTLYLFSFLFTSIYSFCNIGL